MINFFLILLIFWYFLLINLFLWSFEVFFFCFELELLVFMLLGLWICFVFFYEKYLLFIIFKFLRNVGGSEVVLKKVFVILGFLSFNCVYLYILFYLSYKSINL